MRAPRKALFIALILLVTFLQSPLAIIPHAQCAEGDYTGVHWPTEGQSLLPLGITTDGTNFWIVDQTDQEVYKYTMEGVYVDSWDISGQGITQPRGFCTDGSYIWIVHRLGDEVYKYHMNGTYTTEHWDTSGQISFSAGMCTDGSYIWIFDTGANPELYKYEMDGTYTTEHWDTAPAHEGEGITTNGINIWIIDWGADDEVYKYKMDGEYVSSWDTSGETGDAYGITVYGSFFWIVDMITDEVYKYEGPPPTIYPPSDPDLLFGAGFNASTPYVELRWNHSLVDVQFFEVQNSTDKVSWDYLGSNTTAEYTDLQVVNGTERYYRVRACNFTDGNWYNSSFTDIDFETVYFVEAAAAGDTYLTGSVGIFLIVLIIIIPIVFYAVKKR